jgi:hypothetical protein
MSAAFFLSDFPYWIHGLSLGYLFSFSKDPAIMGEPGLLTFLHDE